MPASSADSDRTVTVELRFYAPFKDAVDEKSVVQELPEGATVGDAFARAVETYPGLGETLLDESGELRDGVRALHNGHAAADEDTRLEDGDEISLTTPIHGG